MTAFAQTRGASVAMLSLTTLFASPAPADAPVMPRGEHRIVLASRRFALTAADRHTLASPVPNAPWSHRDRITGLTGFVSTAPLLIDSSHAVVGLASPPSIAWIDLAAGVTRVTALLDDRPAGDLAPGTEGRVFVAAENRVLYTLASDGTVRGSLALGQSAVRSPFARADGSVSVVLNPAAGNGEVAMISADGASLGSRVLAGRVVDAALGVGDCLWILQQSGALCMNASGSIVNAPFGRGASQIFPLDGETVALRINAEIQFRAIHGGAVRGQIEIGPVVQWTTPLPGGRIAIMRGVNPQELVVAASDGTIAFRLPVPLGTRIQGVVGDETGALITVSADGTVVALASDGAVRWTHALHEAITQPPMPLPDAGIMLVRESGTLELLR